MNDVKNGGGSGGKSGFGALLNEVSIITLVQQFAGQLRGYAKESGTACSLPDCDALTLGVRCEQCTRRICMGHAYWKLHVPRVLPYCPYCCLGMNQDLFADDDDDDDDVDDDDDDE